MPNILIIDDNIFELRFVIDALEMRGHNVYLIDSPYSLLEILTEEISFDLIVLDVMLGGWKSFLDTTISNSMLAGLSVATAIRKGGIGVPIIFFSSASHKTIINCITEMEAHLDNTLYLAKHETEPTKLVSILEAFFDTGILLNKQDNILDTILGSIIAKPSFLGIGIDIKKLFGIK